MADDDQPFGDLPLLDAAAILPPEAVEAAAARLKEAAERAAAPPEAPKPGVSPVQNPPAEKEFQLSLLSAISPRTAAELHGLRPVKRGPGRPEGAKNQKTKDRIAALERFYGTTPLQQGWAFVSADPERLAAEMGVGIFAVVQEQNRVRAWMAPFVHQKLPQVIEVEDNRAMLVVDRSGEGVTEDEVVMFEENQWVIDGQARELNADELNADAKPLKDQGETEQ
ncbi:hypothetical protein [Ferrovibrio sp.]|uniref:hypothetical protein n=1 Tax=Ferrovibrio sp. TaxID=1917215 RepID=UPI003D0F892D